MHSGERSGGKASRGSENKIPLVATVSLSDNGNPLRARLSPVPAFTREAIAQWARAHLVPGRAVRSDGLTCFSAVIAAGWTHHPTVVAWRRPRDLPEFQWIDTVLGNLKTSLTGSYHAFDFGKYAAQYLAAFTDSLNRRFDLAAPHKRLLVAAARCGPHPDRLVRLAEGHC